jgi:DNA-binding MarR family transcriptional regulator
MENDLNPAAVAAALQVSIGVFTRQLRYLPVGDELTFSELLALSRLDQIGSATTSDLARAEQITSQAMGATLAVLEDRGLVERRPDPSDGRRILMSMTTSGKRALRGRRDARTEQMAKVLVERFTRAELKALMNAAPLIERLGEGL